MDASNLRLLYGIQCRKRKFPEKVPILVSKFNTPRYHRRWRLKDEKSGEIDENMLKWDLGALSLPIQELDQRPMLLNAKERNIVRRRIQEVKGVARQRASIVVNEPPEPQGRRMTTETISSNDTRTRC